MFRKNMIMAAEQSVEVLLTATGIDQVPAPKSESFVSSPDALTDPGGFAAMATTTSERSSIPGHNWLFETAVEITRNFRSPPKAETPGSHTPDIPEISSFRKVLPQPRGTTHR